MGENEDLVRNAASAAENTVNDATSTTENSKSDKGDSSENPVNDQAVDVENAANDQQNNAVDPVSNQTISAENPANEQLNGAGNPENDQEGGVENLVNDHVNISETPENKEAGGAENLFSDQANVAENPVDDKKDSSENIANNEATDVENAANDQPNAAVNCVIDNDQPNGAVNPANDQEGVVETSASDQADVAETAVNSQAGGAENPVHESESGAEDPVNDVAAGKENSANNKASTAKNAVNDIAGYEQNPENSSADDVKVPVNDILFATENLVEDRADAIGTPEDREEDAVEISSNSEADASEIPVSSKAGRIPEEARDLLKSLAGKWEDVLDASALQVIPLKGAMTNEVYQIKWPTTSGETSRKVLVRIYGEGVDIFFDRDDEIRTFEYMSKNGQGPRLLGRFANGRVEEFIHARTLSASDLRDPSISVLIAAKMREFHALDMPGDKIVNLWHTLRIWLSEAKRLSSPKEVEAFYLDTIDKEISILEKELHGPHQQIGFCHNDLQYGNIMLDEETNSVTIIDYEYASYNPVAYDIANHFCEMAANYHSEMPHILDYNKYPDYEERQRFLKAYLSSSGEKPDDSEVEHLLHEVEKYTLANHLFWGLWGIISGQVNTIDFDYKEYGKQRFQEYWARKPYLLISSDAPSPYNAPEGTGELASVVNSKGSKNHHGILRKMKRVLGLNLFRSNKS